MARMHLRHKEVADLLYATPLGLTDWDIKLLLSTATEFETGRPGCEGWIFFKMFLSGLSGTMFGNLAIWLWDDLMTWVCKTVCSRWWNFSQLLGSPGWKHPTIIKGIDPLGPSARLTWICYTSMARIEYKPFVAAAPEIIEGGRKGWRMTFLDLRTSWTWISLVLSLPSPISPPKSNEVN